MAFDIENTLIFLEDINDFSGGEARKIIRKLLSNDEFKEWLFAPSQTGQNLAATVTKLYEGLTRPKVLKYIIDVIEDEGPREYDRTVATLLISISNIAKEAAVERNNKLIDKRKAGEISEKEYKELIKKVDKYTDMADELQSLAKQIVKRKAKMLAKEATMPKELCVIALYNTPSAKYIDKYKIGFYLNNVLSHVYNYAERESDSIIAIFKSSTCKFKWGIFFKELFGKANTVEAATFILLEGIHRINNFKNSSVRECWDSLTDFALNELNKAPQQLREQMIELYIKRIEKMFSNKSFELRTNLLAISEKDFPQLSDTISKYADKIEAIINKRK